MTLKLQILSDIDAVFLNTDEFAVSVVFTIGGVVQAAEKGIFDAAFLMTINDRAETMPMVAVKSSGAIANSTSPNDTVVIESITYYILEIQPDGTGMSKVILSRNKQR